MEVFGDLQVVLQGSVGVLPWAEVMDFAADFFAPLAVSVGSDSDWEAGVRLPVFFYEHGLSA
jgi:hypothetical protein